jgi:hypothetical protein
VPAFEFFPGRPARLVVPDNWKFGVKQPCYYEPELNPTHNDLAVHHGVGILSARPYHAREKAKVEAGVQVIQRWVLAALHKRQLFTALRVRGIERAQVNVVRATAAMPANRRCDRVPRVSDSLRKGHRFSFPISSPGAYRLEIQKTGFQRLTRDPIQVEVEATVRIDASMQVGDVAQTLEVSAATSLLQTENSSLSQVVEGRTVQEMPLNGRNVLNLVSLVPGVVPQGSTSGNPMGNQNNGGTTNPNGWGNYQIGGGMANQSGSYFDGAPLNVSYVNSVILVPTQDAVQEFRVATNSVSPEFGRFAGGVVNLTSRSGTNAFHGNLYEYFRNGT